VRFYSLWFFEELLELIGISRGVHLDLSNGISTTVCGVFLIPRFLFVINNGSRFFHSNLSLERSWVPFRCWVSLFLTGFTSFGIRAQFLVQVCISLHITILKFYFIILKSQLLIIKKKKKIVSKFRVVIFANLCFNFSDLKFSDLNSILN
jgi:hypothetical protein